ncbi:type I pullulanase [Halosquirtibacter laminarini]|uniref:Type I pullulanase n=1 Tax=Halosquirtibacter laminarini TaxID=3374600 RepID=A0AC61NR21_9BACT|nr:type I pullulanase [Prolixibacteraceae bacterium]
MTPTHNTSHKVDLDSRQINQDLDLGIHYTKEKTSLKLWSLDAKRIIWRIYSNGSGGSLLFEVLLKSKGNGIWDAEIDKDLDDLYYTIQVEGEEGWLNQVPDIYAKSTGINGIRGYIFDSNKTYPDGWGNDSYVKLKRYTDAVLYEMSIRDFTIHPDSGVENSGLFLGLTEQNTQNSYGQSTGLDHLVELGITHVHLLPVADFVSIDEKLPKDKYNWGYDPLNFNTLEGAYSTAPENGLKRMIEFKKMVLALHKKGIGVVLDVVYNHTGLIKNNYFEELYPGYYFRKYSDGTLSNASGCGNELATEKEMVRKYIIDSLKFWCENYHIDGFRFDLMGIYDIETMNIIQEELRAINPSILLYGEGWSADKSVLEENQRAVKANTSKLQNIACFSDEFRDTLKGNQFNSNSLGFISGLQNQEESLKKAIIGGLEHTQINNTLIPQQNWANNAAQVVNYFSCHDDYTIYDKLSLVTPSEQNSSKILRVKLALAITLFSQGIPFLHSGVELLRSKEGIQNSYKSPDFINQIKWSDKKGEIKNLSSYLRNLIKIRKEISEFRLSEIENIEEVISFSEDYIPGIVNFSMNISSKNRWNIHKLTVVFSNHTEILPLNISNEHSFQLDIESLQLKEIRPDISINIKPLSTSIFVCL